MRQEQRPSRPFPPWYAHVKIYLQGCSNEIISFVFRIWAQMISGPAVLRANLWMRVKFIIRQHLSYYSVRSLIFSLLQSWSNNISFSGKFKNSESTLTWKYKEYRVVRQIVIGPVDVGTSNVHATVTCVLRYFDEVLQEYVAVTQFSASSPSQQVLIEVSADVPAALEWQVCDYCCARFRVGKFIFYRSAPLESMHQWFLRRVFFRVYVWDHARITIFNPR